MAEQDNPIDFIPPEKPAQRATAMRKFTCPNCGGEITIRAAGHTLTAICAHCSSVIDVADERVKVLQEVNAKVSRTFLEIGDRGNFRGTPWEVVGYVQKSDRTKVYFWEEYLLFNPYHGFRFLVHMDGHWNFVTVIKRDVEKLGFVCNFWLDDNKYQPFLQDQPIVQYVKGEFYWRIKKGDRAKTEDYVCPPYMLSFEYAEGDTTLSLCEYTEPEEIAAAFALKKEMPRRTGVGPNQPGPVHFAGVKKVCAWALAALVLLQCFNMAMSANQRLTMVQATHYAGDQSRTFTTEPFEVSKASNVLIDSYANVSNSWVELYVSLVNEQTKEVFEVRQPIEYYYGSDSDGPWSEGGTRESDYMSGVPAGVYRLVYELEAQALSGSGTIKLGGAQNSGSVSVSIVATRDVNSWGNFVLTAILMLLCPLYVMMRMSSFEFKRWENSDFPRGEG